MKKIILAAAIATVLAPLSAVADPKVYGALRMAINTGDSEGFVNNASRLGVKGSVGDGGLKGFYHIQMGLNTDGGGAALSSRFAFAGVQGGFGKVVVGRLSSPFKMAGLKVDPFYDTSAGATNSGSNYGLSTLTNGFLNNVVGYISPKLGGAVTVNVVAVLDKNDAGPNVVNTDNLYNIGATYGKSGLTASVQHISGFNGVGVANPTRLTVGYKASAFSVGLSYEDNAGAVDGADQTYLAGTYKVAPKLSLAASVGKVGGNGSGARNSAGDGYTFGAFYKVAPKTTVNLIVSSVDYDAAAATDLDVTSIGFVQKF